MIRTQKQNIDLHILLTKLSITPEEKADLVYLYSSQRTKTSANLYESECAKLIKMLEKRWEDLDEKRDKRRKRVISHLAEAGYTTPQGRPDMNKIHSWVRKQKHKKHLNDHNLKELSSLIKAAEGVRDHYLSKLPA